MFLNQVHKNLVSSDQEFRLLGTNLWDETVRSDTSEPLLKI